MDNTLCVLTLNAMLRSTRGSIQGRLCGHAVPIMLNYMTNRHVTYKPDRILQREESLTHKGMMNIDLTSIKRFKELYGHCFIKQAFRFDSDTEGVGYAGWDLGEHIKRIRRLHKARPDGILHTDRRELNQVGFVWDTRPAKFVRMLNGISTYKQLYGDYLIPTAFKVPHGDDRWSRELWGVALGNSYRNLLNRDRDLTPGEVDMMEKSGVPISTLQNRRADMILLALNTYKALYITTAADTRYHSAQINHMDDSICGAGGSDHASDSVADAAGEKLYFYVPPHYTVPESDERWPESLRGFKLGACVKNIRYNGYYEYRRADFAAVGLSLSTETDMLLVEHDATTERDAAHSDAANGTVSSVINESSKLISAEVTNAGKSAEPTPAAGAIEVQDEPTSYA